MSEELFDWPLEAAWGGTEGDLLWHDRWANRVLDFHGDPRRAGLTVFSDGNHHMALAESLASFVDTYPQVEDVFYLTLPPAALRAILEHGAVRLGNLRLDLQPRLMIGPPDALAPLQASRRLGPGRAFARSRGNALLVRKGNPLNIHGVADLYREDIRIFISNPRTEAASHHVYRQSLCRLAKDAGLDADMLDQRLSQPALRVVHGHLVHHREAPAALAAARADVTPLYYHLALRYTRIFPEHFELIALPGTDTDGVEQNQVITHYHSALIDDGDDWSLRLQDFLHSDRVAAIYRSHGLTPLPATH